MKTKILLIILAIVLFGACPLQAGVWWDSGHHVISTGDTYGEVFLENDASLDFLGGTIGKLSTLDDSLANLHGGTMTNLWATDHSVVSYYSGASNWIAADGNSTVYLYAYDVNYDPTGGINGDGLVEGYFYKDDSYFSFSCWNKGTYSHIEIVPEIVDAELELFPDTLNLASKGKWISCHIKLPEDHNVVDVNSYTVLLQNEVPAEWIWFNEKQNVVKAKFKRSELKEILEPGEIELIVSCHLLDGTYFEGKDTIKVIDKGSKKK